MKQRTTPDQFRRLHSRATAPAPATAEPEPYISQTGMDLLERLLAADDPDPERSTALLIAEQERRRLLRVVRHKLKVFGS